MRALLAQRNTPDSLTGLSPAQVLFGRPLRDFLPLSPGKYVPRVGWRLTAEQREDAHAKRHIKMAEALTAKTKHLLPLAVHDSVSIQDQTGNTPRRWSKTGKIVELLGHDSYLVKVDGSNRVTKRNRQFLRKLSPYKIDTDDFSIPAQDPVNLRRDIPNDPQAPCVQPDEPHQPRDPPTHPGEAGNGVSWTSGGVEEGGNQELDGNNVHPAPQEEDPPHIKLKLFKTSSGWSTSPDSQETMFDGPKQATQPGMVSQYGQASLHTMSPSFPVPVYPPYQIPAPQTMNAMATAPLFRYPSRVNSNPFMMQNNMMPMQQVSSPSYYPTVPSYQTTQIPWS